jgi:hypothetical protein
MKRILLVAVPVWLAFLIYLEARDHDAALVSLVLTPAFGIPLYFALKCRNVLLRMFVGFSFIAHAIGAPFFFLGKAGYGFSGWGAVKNFYFEPVHLFQMYVPVVSSLALIVMFTWAIDLVHFRPFTGPAGEAGGSRVFSRRMVGPPDDPRAARPYTFWLVMLLVMIGLPLNWFMYVNRIGILGLESAPMPYRLTGILVYFRLFILPIVLFWLYTKSSRGAAITVLVVVYALFSGLSSSSRSLYLLALLPVFVTAVAENRKLRVILAAAAAMVGFFLVTASRDTTYVTSVGYWDLLVAVVQALARDEQGISVMTVIGGIANRLYGAQDIVLAYQYEPANPWTSLMHFFTTGGNANSVVPDLGNDLYGFRFEEGSGFGLGLGVLAFVVMLVHSSLARLLVATLLISLMLSMSSRIIGYASRELFGAERSLVMSFVAMIVTLSIYQSSLNFFYMQVGFILAVALTVKGLKRFRIRPRQAYPVTDPV